MRFGGILSVMLASEGLVPVEHVRTGDREVSTYILSSQVVPKALPFLAMKTPVADWVISSAASLEEGLG